jgi:hypothetical protein
VTGHVLGGGAPLVGATVDVYAAGNAAVLGSSVSATDGSFSIDFYNPGGSSLLYAVAAGGNPGSGVNAAIKLATLLGTAADFSSPSSFVVNDLTTVASIWPLAQFLDAGGALNGPATSLAVAAATAANLADFSTGAAAHRVQAGANDAKKLDTLANLLAACVVSGGTASAPCSGLFTSATAAGTAAPADTLAAALFIALHPAANVAALSALASGSTAYTPALVTVPSDWTLSLNFVGGGLSEPTQVALDAGGNVWVANYNNAVTELSPAGAALSPAQGFTGGGLEESFGIAVDAAGHVWVCNEQSSSSINSGRGSLTKLAADGSILSGTDGYAGGGLDFPDAIAIDASGNVWIGNFGNSTLSAFSAAGAVLSPAAGFTGGGLSFPTGIAFDAGGNLWVADSGASQVSAFSAAGAALSPAGGYIGGGIYGPQALALDRHGNAWIANFYSDPVAGSGNSISELDAHGNPLSPGSGYSGGGLASPGGVAIDGQGNVWVTNYDGNSITELAGADAASPGAALSPGSGFTGAGLSQPFSPAIDSAGNLWTANFGNNSVTQFIGVAAPVRVPLLGVPQAP